MGGRMDGRMEGRTDGWMDIHVKYEIFLRIFNNPNRKIRFFDSTFARLQQNLLLFYSFLRFSLTVTMLRTKHVGGTS